MTSASTRRGQNAGGSEDGIPFDLDGMIEKQMKSDAARKAYQQRPDVQEKRKAYQDTQNSHRKIARAAMKGDVRELTSLGLTQEQAEQAVTTATRVQAAT